VNADDTKGSYRDLASQWPTFWPHDIGDTRNDDRLNWSPDAHTLFLDYRNKLRKVWAGDAETRLSSVLAYLLGIISIDELMGREYVLDVDALWFEAERSATARAWQLLQKSHPGATIGPHSMVFPLWGLGNLCYLPRSDFENALWLLCQENWRARVCCECKRYFIADKAARRYCSTGCYGAAKRGQRLAWWNKAGKIKRAQKGPGSSRKRRSRARRQESQARRGS
jgi:hypothetical protein